MADSTAVEAADQKPDCPRKRKMDDLLDGSPSPPSSSSCLSTVDSGPEEEVDERAEAVCHGVASVVGRRRDMEDAVAVARGFWGNWDFYGVYDGHGGSEIAEACRDRIHLAVARAAERIGSVGSAEWWRQAMEDGFHEVDEEVGGAEDEAAEMTVGATAVVAVVGDRAIVVANCGDSRAVLCRGGTPLPLSDDHKPNRPDELKRIEAAGGKVINWDGYRVLGVLATSRSIGDQYLKPYVTSQPEVTITAISDKDEFIILASDGLWDVVSNRVACCVVRRCLAGRLAGRPADCGTAAVALVELALSRGSSDNISVVVVELKGASTGARA